jgi:lipopolysaccharide export system permease protein
VLRLVDGTVDHIAATAEEPVTRVTFKRMDYNILPETTVDLDGKDPYEMYPGELYQFLLEKGEKAKGRDWMAFHKKFAYPLSALLLGILGMALGISDPRHGKGRGYLYGLGVMVLYYLLVRFGDGFGERRVIPPLVAAWLPNAVFLVFGVWLFAAQAREEETFLERLLARFSR